MNKLPSGTITFLFTDIEGSTQTLQALRDGYSATLADHRRLLREAFAKHGGVEVDTQGDAFFVAFERATAAIQSAADGQRALAAHDWVQGRPVRVRMGIHAGEAIVTDEGYVGMAVHHAARIAHAAHGGQILVSSAAWQLARESVPEGYRVSDLGSHLLKDLVQPEPLYQLVHADLPTQFPPPRTLTVAKHNLPAQPTPLIGREREAREVADLLSRTDVRLLTLAGAGGVGKTRLALDVAAGLADEFDDGVWFVALAGVSEAGLVSSAVAKALAVDEIPGRSLLDAMLEQLSDKALLLVLDNFEHVLDAATLLARILESCPRVKTLVTTRARLNLRGEHEYPVEPLSVAATSGGHVLASPAVELFVERAKSARPGFDPTDETDAIAEICRRLDGLPLAIELAAARIRLLPPKAMLERLERRLPLLTGGARDLPERHRSLQETIRWSYELLSDEERTLFETLSVFGGGATIESADSTLSDAAVNVDAFAGLASLVDKSLLRQIEDPGGEPRFVMLQTLREFGLERLAADAPRAGATFAAHARYFIAMAGVWLDDLGGRVAAQFDAIERDIDNFRSALEYAIIAPQAALAASLVNGLREFWLGRGYFSEGRAWTTRILENLPLTPDQAALVRHASAAIAVRQGDFDEARTLIETTLDSVGEAVPDMRAVQLYLLGSVALAEGETEAARGHFSDALALHRSLGRDGDAARCLLNLGVIAYAEHDFETARSLYEGGLEYARSASAQELIAHALNNLGAISLDMGDLADARAQFEESLRLRRELSDRRGIAESTLNVGAVEHALGNHAAAHDLYTESLGIRRELGDRSGIIETLNNMGELATDEGALDDAAAYLEEGLAIGRDLEDSLQVAQAWMLRARLAVRAGHGTIAAEAAASSARIFRHIGAREDLLSVLLLMAELDDTPRDELRGILEEGSSVAALVGDEALQSRFRELRGRVGS